MKFKNFAFFIFMAFTPEVFAQQRITANEPNWDYIVSHDDLRNQNTVTACINSISNRSTVELCVSVRNGQQPTVFFFAPRRHIFNANQEDQPINYRFGDSSLAEELFFFPIRSMNIAIASREFANIVIRNIYNSLFIELPIYRLGNIQYRFVNLSSLDVIRLNISADNLP